MARKKKEEMQTSKLKKQSYYDEIFRGYVNFENDNVIDIELSKRIKAYAVLNKGIVMLDIDSHERSNRLVKALDDEGINYYYQNSTNGSHIFFRTNKRIKKSVKKVLNCGVLVDIVSGENLKTPLIKNVNGQVEYRPITKKFNDGEELSELPIWLEPSKAKQELTSMKTGDGRDDAVLNHIIPLKASGMTKTQWLETLDIIQNYILGDKLSRSELKKFKTDKWDNVKTKSKTELNLVNAFDSMSEIPPKEATFLIDTVLSKGGINLLTGDAKTMKTMIALCMVVSVATGKKLFDTFNPKEIGKTIMISTESDVRIRLLKLIKGLGCEPSVAMREILLIDPNQHDDADWDSIKEHLDGWIEEHKPKLLVLDPLTYIFDGNQINDNEPVKLFFKYLKNLISKYNITVLIVHHNNRMEVGKKMNAVSGSAGITRFSNSIMYLNQFNEDVEQDINKSDEELNRTDKCIKFTKGHYRDGGEGYKYYSLTFNFEDNVISVKAERYDPKNDKCVNTMSKVDKIEDIVIRIKAALYTRVLKESFNFNTCIACLDGFEGLSRATFERHVKTALKRMVDNGDLKSSKGKYAKYTVINTHLLPQQTL